MKLILITILFVLLMWLGGKAGHLMERGTGILPVGFNNTALAGSQMEAQP